MINKIVKDIKGFFKVQDKAKFLKQNIPYLAFFYLGDIFSNHIRAYSGGNVIDKIFQGILEIDKISLVPSIHHVGEPERILNPMWMKSLKTTSS